MNVELAHFEDLSAPFTYELGKTTLDEAEIIAFAKLYDPQPFHLDAELAKDSIFEGLVASGWHTAAIYMRMLVDGMLNKVASQGGPGVTKLAWLAPVRPGDILEARFHLLRLEPSATRQNIGKYFGRGEMFKEDSTKVYSFEMVGFIARRMG